MVCVRLQDTADSSAGRERCPVTVTSGLRGHMILHVGSGAGPRAVGEVTGGTFVAVAKR